MSTFRDQVNDAVSKHPDAVVLAFACVVLFLVVANFLWARRGARLEKVIEELTASRDALTHLLQRPDAGAGRAERPERPGERYSVVDRGPRSQREAVLGTHEGSEPAAEQTDDEPAAAASTQPASTAPEDRPAMTTPAVAEAVDADTTVRMASAEIPASWRAPEEAAPAAAAWAAGPKPDEEAPEPSPFRTMSLEPVAEAKAPAFSFGRPADGEGEPARKPELAESVASWAAVPPSGDPEPITTAPDSPERDPLPERLEVVRRGPMPERLELSKLERDPEPLPLPSRTPGTPTPLEAAYGAWDSLNSAPPDAASVALDIANDPAYAAWSAVTGTRPAALPAPQTASPTPPDPAPPAAANGNGRIHNEGDGHDNGAHADAPGLDEVTTVVAPADGTQAAQPDEKPEPARSGGGILLVEDDDNVAKVYRIVLESKGHTVRHAGDGVAALEEVRRGRPDLVLLDVMMPRMNGILFLQSLRAQSDMRDVPVVILSNFREPRLVDRAMALGALEYIVKAQTKPETIVSAVPRWMAGERAFHA